MVSGEIDENADPKSLQVNSSISTIGSLINQMVGGTMLVLPLLFNQTGIVTGFLVMTITGLVSCKANLIYVDHLKPKEMDFQQSIRRIMGTKYEWVYRFAKWLYLFFIVMIYFTLITEQLYDIVQFILASAKVSTKHYVPDDGKSNQFQMGKMNMFYMTFATLGLTFLLVSLKEIAFLIKIAGYGVSTIISYCLFIFILFFYMLGDQGPSEFDHNVKDIKFFSGISTLAGTSAMAFAVQINSCSAIKCNKVQKNNIRDITITYICGWFIYVSIGVFGAFGVKAIQKPQVCPYNTIDTITGCFSSTNVATLVVILIYVAHLISAFPIYYNLARKAFFTLFFGGKPPAQKWIMVIDLCSLLFFAIINNIPGLKPGDLMSLNGSVCCFFYVFSIPLLMDIQCYHGDNKFMKGIKRSLSKIGLIDETLHSHGHSNDNIRKQSQAMVLQGNQQLQEDKKQFARINNNEDSMYSDEQKNTNKESDECKIENQNDIKKGLLNDDQKNADPAHSQSSEEEEEGQEEEMSNYQRKISCNYHEGQDEYKTVRIIVYFFIWLMGLAILVYEFYLICANLFT